VLGTALDLYGVYNYYNDPTSEFTVSPTEASINAGITAYGLSNPAVAILYGAAEAFYPGGAKQALTDNGERTMKVQEVLGPNWRMNGRGGN